MLKRILSFIFALLLVTSVSFGVFSANAEEEEPLDAYVLHHNVPDNGYTGPRFQYFSPYVTNYTYDGTATYIQNYIYTLYNTVSKEVVPAYCTDIKVGALPDHRYRRLNLEDSTYAAGAAGLLRAIVHRGFYLENIPNESTADHNARVTAKLTELGNACGVPDLTIGEAISGTQSAIWQAAHGSILEFTDFVRTIYTTKQPSLTRYYDLCNAERENGHIEYSVSSYGQVTIPEEADAYLNARIKAVYDYLLSLTPVAPEQKAVSASSFEHLGEPDVKDNGDGTYDVSVTTTVDVLMSADDYLTLSASIDDQYAITADLHDGEQTVTLTIENVPENIANDDVYLTIKGMQTAYDVYIYDAYGGRDTAQTMIGMDGSQLPVYARVVANTDRKLNFYKTTLVATGDNEYLRRPLEGITFDIYFIATLEDYAENIRTLPDVDSFDFSEMADHTVITDEEGRASVNFTQHGLPDGIYLVAERSHPAIKEPVKPFFIFMPTTNANGDGYDYEITVQPKNDVKGELKVDKDINKVGNNEAASDAYSKHTWIVGTNIPEDIANGKLFTVSDTLDSRLDFLGNMRVTVESLDGETVIETLVEGSDYTLTLHDVDSLSEGNPSDSFVVSLTHTGMQKIGNSVGDNFTDYMLRVRFDSQINSNADVAVEIPNQALVKYTNSVNFEFNAESDKPVVSTGGGNISKVDSRNPNKLLEGAIFEIFRRATADEVTAGGDNLVTLEGMAGSFVKVSFFDNPELKGEKVTLVTSNDLGEAGFYGLAYGEYFIVETKAPGGYNLLGDIVPVTIDRMSHIPENSLKIENVKGSLLPSTGGMGTTIFTISGSVLLLVCCIVLVIRKQARR